MKRHFQVLFATVVLSACTVADNSRERRLEKNNAADQVMTESSHATVGTARDRSGSAPATNDVTKMPAQTHVERLSSVGAIHVATRPSNNFPIPESIAQGRFEVSSACLVFAQAGAAPALALMPPGSRVSKSTAGEVTVMIGNRSIRLGQPVSVSGGPIPSGAEREYGLSAPRPSACPSQIFAVGGLQ